ncbi:MAG: histidine kinase [Flavobacteriaceae bacterium]|nr:histidine kinase [Flavobacteriaceae bacterium]
MKRFFIHHPIFRIISPLFGGTLVYLLLLLINNNISQLGESFFGEELYICIGLTYLIQEMIRWAILGFKKLKKPSSELLRASIQVMVTLLGVMALVSTVMFLYFKYVLLYTPNFSELQVLNLIFLFIGLVYMVLYFSHQFLYRTNTEKKQQELSERQSVEEAFRVYQKGINPELLFESLESMLATMKNDPDKAEEMTDHFSSVYRYILSQNQTELVSLAEELDATRSLVALFDNLPHRSLKLEIDVDERLWIPPKTLLAIIEQIIRSTIASSKKELKVSLESKEGCMKIRYQPEERLRYGFDLAKISDVVKKFGFFSSEPIRLDDEATWRTLTLPILNYDESSPS